MNASFDYYLAFYYVAKYGNMTLAARKTGGNQPNLTRVIRNLESQVSSTLFIRSPKGMQLTQNGARLYERIRPAVERIIQAEEELLADNSLKTGHISLSVTEIALRSFLLPELGHFRCLYPGVRMKICSQTSREAIKVLQEGMADLAVVTTPVDMSVPNLEMSVLQTFKEVAVCGMKFQSLASKPRTLKDLSRYPLISLASHSATYEGHMACFTAQGLEFMPEIEAATADQIIPLARQNLGIGFVPEVFLEHADGVLVIPLVDALPERSICAICNKELPLNAATRAFLSQISQSSEKM